MPLACGGKDFEDIDFEDTEKNSARMLIVCHFFLLLTFTKVG